MVEPTRPTTDLAALARLRDALLHRAARDHGSLFGEVARDVLAGRTTLRDAATSGAYAEMFTQAGARLSEALRNRGPGEPDAEAAARGVAALTDRLERELSAADEPPPPPSGDADDDAPFSVLQRAPKNDYGTDPSRTTWKRRW